MTKTKSDEQILFPEEEIDGVTIKPWSFGMLFDISSSLERVVDKAEMRGLLEEINTLEGTVPYTVFIKIFTVCSEEVLNIMSMTLNIDEEDIKKWNMQKGLKIAYKIYEQNRDVIMDSVKNVFSTPPGKKEEKED